MAGRQWRTSRRGRSDDRSICRRWWHAHRRWRRERGWWRRRHGWRRCGRCGRWSHRRAHHPAAHRAEARQAGRGTIIRRRRRASLRHQRRRIAELGHRRECAAAAAADAGRVRVRATAGDRRRGGTRIRAVPLRQVERTRLSGDGLRHEVHVARDADLLEVGEVDLGVHVLRLRAGQRRKLLAGQHAQLQTTLRNGSSHIQLPVEGRGGDRVRLGEPSRHGRQSLGDLLELVRLGVDQRRQLSGAVDDVVGDGPERVLDILVALAEERTDRLAGGRRRDLAVEPADQSVEVGAVAAQLANTRGQGGGNLRHGDKGGRTVYSGQHSPAGDASTSNSNTPPPCQRQPSQRRAHRAPDVASASPHAATIRRRSTAHRHQQVT